jgi:hypothetical protein
MLIILTLIAIILITVTLITIKLISVIMITLMPISNADNSNVDNNAELCLCIDVSNHVGRHVDILVICHLFYPAIKKLQTVVQVGKSV